MTEKQAKLLAYPFTADEIEWRVLLTTKDKKQRAGRRIHPIPGPSKSGWTTCWAARTGKTISSPCRATPTAQRQHICEISIYYPDRREWITKK